MTYVWAYCAGLLTLINPCVLPLLPVVLAASLQRSRFGPAALAAGLTSSFTAVGVGVSAFGWSAGIDGRMVAHAAAAAMILFGAVLLVPRATNAFAIALSPVAGRADAGIGRVGRDGMTGQFVTGTLLGAVWSPCIGPTLGGAIGLAASGEGLAQAILVMLMFGAGVSTILVGLAYGSRRAVEARRERLAAWMPWAKPVMGGTLVAVGLAIILGIDRTIEAVLLDALPEWLVDLSVSI